MSEEEQQPAAAGDQQQVQFGIQKLYLKDLSFEAPNSPQIFTEQLNPKVDMQLANNTTDLGNNHHEVVLTVTVTVKEGEKSVYLVEVQQAGIFMIVGVPDDQMNIVLSTACPNVLFPFAREAVCDIVQKGGFPQLLLAPVNFDMLYAQELQRREQAAPPATEH